MLYEPMGRTESENLDKHREQLEDILEPTDILKMLLDYDVIDEDDIDSVRNTKPTTRTTRITTLIKILKSRGKTAYPGLLQALKEFAKYKDLVAMLELEKLGEMEPNPKEDEFQGDLYKTIPRRVRDKPVDSKILSKISDAVGTGWEHIVLRLNLPQVQIDHSKEEHKFKVSLQLYSCLNKWSCSSPNANLGQLIDILWECRQTVEINWKVITKTLNDDSNK